MERRDFLKIFSFGTVAAMSLQLGQRPGARPAGLATPGGFADASSLDDTVLLEDMSTSVTELARNMQLMSTPAPDVDAYLSEFTGESYSGPILATTASPSRHEYIEKMTNFERVHQEDVYLARDQYPLLISTFKHLDRVQNLVGHGNFNILSFDEMIRYGKQYDSVGRFSAVELEFMEDLFEANPSRYGFMGEKVITTLTAAIPEKDRLKVRRTGHFLYRGESEALYEKLKRDLGESIVLTSGIRSVVKQTHLFLAKTIQSRGNLSRASRSLAPPGHSYHGVGDFDVGKVGYGRKNFTEAFAKTEEFRRLVDLGYVDIRYHRNNMLGVRYEPWHIKVV
ncbi:MAG: M15 family metallopeptidase [Proteobacteria bacterium]|nr:M15 family metallopeptidase [Pseudomonadota bacterium]